MKNGIEALSLIDAASRDLKVQISVAESAELIGGLGEAKTLVDSVDASVAAAADVARALQAVEASPTSSHAEDDLAALSRAIEAASRKLPTAHVDEVLEAPRDALLEAQRKLLAWRRVESARGELERGKPTAGALMKEAIEHARRCRLDEALVEGAARTLHSDTNQKQALAELESACASCDPDRLGKAISAAEAARDDAVEIEASVREWGAVTLPQMEGGQGAAGMWANPNPWAPTSGSVPPLKGGMGKGVHEDPAHPKANHPEASAGLVEDVAPSAEEWERALQRARGLRAGWETERNEAFEVLVRSFRRPLVQMNVAQMEDAIATAQKTHMDQNVVNDAKRRLAARKRLGVLTALAQPGAPPQKEIEESRQLGELLEGAACPVAGIHPTPTPVA